MQLLWPFFERSFSVSKFCRFGVLIVDEETKKFKFEMSTGSGTYTHTYNTQQTQTQHTPEEWSEAIEDIYDKLKSGKATKGEVFRLLTSLQKSDDDLAVEKKRPPIPPPVQNRNGESALDEKSSKALSVSEFLKNQLLWVRSNSRRNRDERKRRDKRRKRMLLRHDEHTYRPQIKELPKSYGSNRAYESVEFNKRVNDWKAKKAETDSKEKRRASHERT